MIEEEVADHEDRGESSPRSQVEKVAKENSKRTRISQELWKSE